MSDEPEHDQTQANKIYNLEELRKRIENAQEVNVDPSGRLIDPAQSQQEGTNSKPTTKIKPQRWFSKPWYTNDPARLVLEQRVMKERFPQFELRRDGNQLVWFGTLESNSNQPYEMALYYPDNFPAEPPKIFPITPALTVWKDEQNHVLKHQFNDGSLCLFHPRDRTWQSNTTAATLLAITSLWLFAYESYVETGQWIGLEAD